MAQNNVNIQITASNQASGTLTSLSSQFNQLNNDVDKISRRFTELNSAITSLAGVVSLAGVAAMTKSFVDAGLQLEKMTKLFNAAAGSASLGARELEYIRETSKKMGLEFTSTAESYGKFAASIRNTTLEGEAGRKVFESVSGATSALGLSADETKGVFNALQQMMSKGKVQAEELRGQLGERLPGAFKMAADAMGITTAELDKQLKDGNVLASDLLPKLAIQLDKTYGKAAVEGAASAAAEFNRFKNAVFDSSSAIGTALLPAFASIMKGLTPLVEKVKEFIGGFQIMAIKAASMPDRVSAGWQVIKSGKGLFSKEGQDMYGKLSAPINQVEEEMINELMAKYMGSGSAYTAEEKARHAAIKPMKLDDTKANTSAFDSMITSWNSQLRKSKESGSALENALSQNAFDFQKLLDQFSVSPDKAKLAAEGITKATILSLRDKIGEQLKVKDWEKRMVELTENGDLQTASDKAVLGINTLQPGLSSTARYKATPLKNYRLMTNQQYSIPQAGPDYEKGRAAFMGLEEDLKNPYDKQLAQLRKYYDEKKAIINEFEAKNYDEQARKSAALLALDEQVSQKRINVEMQKWESIGGIISGQLGQLAGMMDKGNKEQFIAWKALAMAQATIATAMAVVGIMANEALTKGMLAVPLAITAGAIGVAQIAMIAATNYQARAMGGPVTGGTTYLIGEQGPELFTPGASGIITPNDKIGAGGANVHQIINIDARGADATVTAKIQIAMKQAKEEAVSAVLASMNRGGAFALASGRR